MSTPISFRTWTIRQHNLCATWACADPKFCQNPGRLRSPAKYRRQSALVYFDAPLQRCPSFATHHSCSTNNRSIVLSPSSSQATKPASEFPSVIAEITVSAKHVAANFCQNVHSLSAGLVDRSQNAEMVSGDVALSNTTRSPGSKVARSTISLNAWH
ncbi:hypothetical protein B0H14DRAFT_2748716, partial [Mycena olivaceomarginata]